MIISVLRDVEYKSSTGIVDETEQYSKNVNQTFKKGMELRDGENIFERTGATLTPTPYVVGDEQSYVLNQIMWKDNKIQYVSALVGNDVQKEPEEYTPAPPENLGFGAWGNRYVKLGVLVNNTWTKATNGITHKLYSVNGSWKYSLTKNVQQTYWEYLPYTSSLNNAWTETYSTSVGKTTVKVYDGITLVHTSQFSGRPITNAPKTVVGTNGKTYKRGSWLNSGTSVIYIFSLHRHGTKTVVSETTRHITLTDSVTKFGGGKAYCYNNTNCTNEWFPSVVVLRGNVLYIRSDTDDVAQTKNVNGVTYADVNYLTDAGGWGWTFIRPSDVFAPLDRKKYTVTKAAAPVTYTVTGTKPFDTIAINGLILDTDTSAVEITFLPSDGSAAIPMVTITPDSNRDEDGRLSKYQTTTIAYAPRDIVGDVKLEFKDTGNVSIGGIMLGLSVDAGFTNLVFTNKFIDRSPYERNSWGDVLYVPGLKQNVFKGTVDILVRDYDMVNRLMTSIGGETVIINGSDSKTNQPVDDVNFFSSTMLIGRMKGFELKTKLENKDMSQMATYNIEVEEDV